MLFNLIKVLVQIPIVKLSQKRKNKFRLIPPKPLIQHQSFKLPETKWTADTATMKIEETQEHLEVCEATQEMRGNLDMRDDPP